MIDSTFDILNICSTRGKYLKSPLIQKNEVIIILKLIIKKLLLYILTKKFVWKPRLKTLHKYLMELTDIRGMSICLSPRKTRFIGFISGLKVVEEVNINKHINLY